MGLTQYSHVHNGQAIQVKMNNILTIKVILRKYERLNEEKSKAEPWRIKQLSNCLKLCKYRIFTFIGKSSKNSIQVRIPKLSLLSISKQLSRQSIYCSPFPLWWLNLGSVGCLRVIWEGSGVSVSDWEGRLGRIGLGDIAKPGLF